MKNFSLESYSIKDSTNTQRILAVMSKDRYFDRQAANELLAEAEKNIKSTKRQ